MASYQVNRIEDMLARFESQLKTRQAPHWAKELVFNRVRVLKSQGYVEDVAFAKALREHNFSA